MNFLGEILSRPVIASIGWTIIHSLWQGLVIGVIFGTLMYFLRKNSPSIRYVIGSFLLFLMVIISLVTFISVYSGEITNNPLMGTNVQPGTGIEVDKGSPGILLTLKGFFSRHLPIIVSIWILGILLFFFKFAGGILYNQRLKVLKTKEINGYWAQRLTQLRLKINLRKKVTIKESDLTRTPLTIGHLKPLILIPTGFITGMPADQIEALIVHELAHIVRRDYIINIFQNIMEILYFYHPVVRWISNHLRSERENCCDDMAVEVMGDSLSYAKALTRIGEGLVDGNKKADLAMAVSKNSLKLLKRIRRLFKMTTKRSKFSEGFIGIFTMIFFAFALVLGANAASGISPEAGIEMTTRASDKSVDKKEEKLKAMMVRYYELRDKGADLTKAEKEEYLALAHKFRQLQQTKAEEEYKKVTEELKFLKKKKTLTKEEKVKVEKLKMYIQQKQVQLKNQELYIKYKKLKSREKELTKQEQKELQKITTLLKKQKELEEKKKRQQLVQLSLELKKLKKREKQLSDKELSKMKKLQAYLQAAEQKHSSNIKKRQEELVIAYKKLKAKEKELNKKEKEKLKQITIVLKKMKQQEEHKKQIALYQKYMELKNLKRKLSKEETEKMKKLEAYLKQLKSQEEIQKKKEILEKRKQLEKIAQLYVTLKKKKGSLSKAEEDKLIKATVYMTQVEVRMKDLKNYLQKLDLKYKDYQKKEEKLSSIQKKELALVKAKMAELKYELAYYEKLTQKIK